MLKSEKMNVTVHHPIVLETAIEGDSLTRDNLMFIAMNRFKIVPGHEEAFEKLWKERDSHLKDVKGFKSFNHKGAEGRILYALRLTHRLAFKRLL